MIDPENETLDEGGLEVEVAPVESAEPAQGKAEARLHEKLAAAEKEKQDTYERLLRTTADFDNFRKRARKDQEEAKLKAREDLLKEILPGIDNLERALAVLGTGSDAVLNGVKMVLRQFQAALERFDVKSFEAVGQPFDPGRHEAIAQVETAEQPAGTVVTEMQRGYTIGPRLLRPALVTVAKAPAPASASTSTSVEAAPDAEEQGDT